MESQNAPLILPSFPEALDKIELYLSTNLHLPIPEIYPRDNDSRFKIILKLLSGLNPPIVIEQLPFLLTSLEDPSNIPQIFDLLQRILHESPDEIFEVLIQSTKTEKIKKNSLSLIKDLIEKNNFKGLHRVIHGLGSLMNDPDKETSKFAREIVRKLRDTIFRTTTPVKESEGSTLVFGVIPPQLFEEFSSSEDKKGKLVALKSIEEILCNLTEFQVLKPYETEILSMLKDVLMDPNRAFVGSGLRICVSLCNASFDFCKLSNILRSKLADPSIPYRKSAFKVLLHSITLIPSLPSELISDLQNGNWHIREEALNLIIGGALKGLKYENIELVPVLAKLLDDDKSKIRQVTEEAFAVLAKVQGEKELLEKLQPIVDELELARLKSRIEIGTLPRLEGGNIVFPRTVPNSAPLIQVTELLAPSTSTQFLAKFAGMSFSPTPTSTQEFKFTDNTSTATPGPRSSSLVRDKGEISSIFRDKQSRVETEERSMLRQSSEFLKPPLPKRSPSGKSLPSFTKEEFKKSIIDKTYMGWDELEIVKQPLEEYTRVCMVTEDNWEKQFEAVDVYRRLIKHHKDFIDSQNSHKIIIDLVKWGDSLRSALSKNSLLAIGEFCQNHSKFLDPDIDSIFNLLLRKSADTNLFILEVATESLIQCVSNCNINKVINCILSNMASAKSGNLKSKLALCSKCVLQKIGKSFPSGVDRIVISVAGYVQEAAPEVRESARECFLALGKDLDKILSKYLPENTRRAVKDIIEKDAKRRVSNKSESRRRSISSKSTQRRSSISRSSSNRLRISQNLQEDVNFIQDINADLNSEDWKIRQKTLSKISSSLSEECKSKKSTPKLVSLFDCFCRTLNDQNSKISQQSLQTLKDLIPKLGQSLEPNLGLLITSLIGPMGSTSQSIRESAKEVCDLILQSCDHLFIIGPFTSAINVANPKARSMLIDVVSKTIPTVHTKKPLLLNKFAVPLLCKVIEDPNMVVREQAEKLAIALFRLAGEQIFAQIPSSKQEKVREAIKSV